MVYDQKEIFGSIGSVPLPPDPLTTTIKFQIQPIGLAKAINFNNDAIYSYSNDDDDSHPLTRTIKPIL